jgi:hypothetical protein
MGVGELEVPAAGQSRRNDLRALDAHPETSAGGRRAYRHRGLAGGRPHGGRCAVRGRRGRCERAAQDAGSPESDGRRHARRCRSTSHFISGVAQAPRPPPGRCHRRPRNKSADNGSGSQGRRGGALRVCGKDRRGPATAETPPALGHVSGSKRSAGHTRSASRGPAPGPGGGQRYRIRSSGRPVEPRHQATPPPIDRAQAGGSRASMYSMTRRVSCDGVEAPLVTPTFFAPFSHATSRSSSRSTR